MFTRLSKILLFISSYSPLLIIYSIQEWDSYRNLAIITLFTSILSILVLLVVLKIANDTTPDLIKVSRVQQKDAEVMVYVITYLFPFIGVDLSNCSNLISIGIFFMILGIIYVNSNMIHINPILSALGYHIYEVETDNASDYTIISTQRITKNQKLNAVKIGDYIFLEKSR